MAMTIRLVILFAASLPTALLAIDPAYQKALDEAMRQYPPGDYPGPIVRPASPILADERKTPTDPLDALKESDAIILCDALIVDERRVFKCKTILFSKVRHLPLFKPGEVVPSFNSKKTTARSGDQVIIYFATTTTKDEAEIASYPFYQLEVYHGYIPGVKSSVEDFSKTLPK